MRDITNKLHCFNILCLTFFPTIAFSVDTLTSTQSLTNNQTLVSSPAQLFELGFFTPDNSRWYFGIWYKKIPVATFVWVANRDQPLSNPSNTFKFGDQGSIVVVNESGTIFWSSNQTQGVNPVVQLLDTGNLVVREESSADNYLWQSFDYPTDTLLPGMKLGWDLDANVDRYLTSWKNPNDPSTGAFSFQLDFHGFPEIFLWRNQERVYRSGPWNGLRFSGTPEMEHLDGLSFEFANDQHKVYYSFSETNASLISRLIMNSTGYLQRFVWIESSQVWNLFWYSPKDPCDYYNSCGPYGMCDSNASPICKCVKGFVPKNLQAWNMRDGVDGCVRNTSLACEKDKFLPLNNMKLPDSTTAFVNKSMSLTECQEMCLKNCSCTAYANYQITGQGVGGCVIWTGELLDMRVYAEGSGQDIYVRLAASEIDNVASVGFGSGSEETKQIIVVIASTIGIVIALSGLIACFLWKRNVLQSLQKGKTEQRARKRRLKLFNDVTASSTNFQDFQKLDEGRRKPDLPIFDISIILAATDNFSPTKKLGQGGFGPVYKGQLADGQEIAVKTLSRSSKQGIKEFKNEVVLITKLQHRNLVRLFGCCIHKEERMLIYEYMPNKSLDFFIFDEIGRQLLDWSKRFEIISGIARGVLYLHRDSRLKIIHRDLKTSNVLLDATMNPKISDFGLARMFGDDQIEANTNRVVGTYGYMAPEYAMEGLYSTKSDVFSYGVLTLEIISGKRNNHYHVASPYLNLIGHVWDLWMEGKALDIIDSSLGQAYPAHEVSRCIQIGLLCVQEQATDRPTMVDIVSMLGNEKTLPTPNKPAFINRRNKNYGQDSSNSAGAPGSINDVTISMLEVR